MADVVVVELDADVDVVDDVVVLDDVAVVVPSAHSLNELGEDWRSTNAAEIAWRP